MTSFSLDHIDLGQMIILGFERAHGSTLHHAVMSSTYAHWRTKLSYPCLDRGELGFEDLDECLARGIRSSFDSISPIKKSTLAYGSSLVI